MGAQVYMEGGTELIVNLDTDAKNSLLRDYWVASMRDMDGSVAAAFTFT